MDLLIAPDANGRADIVFSDGDLELDMGLRSLVLVSLFSDRRSDGDHDEGGTSDPRGWFARPDGFGSLLWVLEERVVTDETAADARDFVRRALAWIVDEEIANEVQAGAAPSTDRRGELDITVQLVRGGADGAPDLWDGELGDPSSLEIEGVLLHLIAGL